MSEKRHKRVLIADDDPIIRALLASIVTKEGYATVEVNDGREAFRLLQTDAQFGLAILDLKMPGLSGADLVAHMHTEKRLRRIPVVLVTAETDAKIMSEVFAAGALAYLTKPFSREQVQRVVRMLLNSTTAEPVAA